MTITLRVDKGAPLTIAELDGNFTDLDGRLVVVEDNQGTYKSIDEITQAGNALFVEYTDASQDGPFVFEVSINFRGDWEPLTVYQQNDLVHASGVIYIVLLAHTSGSVFDPGANAGTAGDYYAPFLAMPELTIPDGGGTGYVLTKATDDDFDYYWANAGIPVGGTSGQVLAKISNDDYDTEWIASGAESVSTVLGITAATLSLDASTYSNKYLRCTHAAGCAVTFPPDDEFQHSSSTEIHFRQCSSNPVTLVGGSSTAGTVTFNVPTGFEAETAAEGAVITTKKVGVNNWDVFGLLAASSA